MRHPLYLVYSLCVLGFMAMAQFRGWTLSPLNQARELPRSVRDNPGAYRPNYVGSSRYVGGK
jgi:hypothetical protein